jgi:hypothetical protein
MGDTSRPEPHAPLHFSIVATINMRNWTKGQCGAAMAAQAQRKPRRVRAGAKLGMATATAGLSMGDTQGGRVTKGTLLSSRPLETPCALPSPNAPVAKNSPFPYRNVKARLLWLFEP